MMTKHLTLHRRIEIYCLVFTWIIIYGTVAYAATYYVATDGHDSVSCAIATNVSTPKHTLFNALGCLSAGDTLFIRAGTYEETIDSNTRTIPTGTSWSAPVTISGYPGEIVTLNPSSCAVLNLPASYLQYIVFRNLILDASHLEKSPTKGCYGISIQPGTHHLRFLNLEVKNSPWNGIIAGGSHHEFINLKVHSSGNNGAYLTTTNSLIDGGEWYNNQCYGVRILDSDGTKSADGNVIKNGRIFRNGRTAAFNGTATCSSGGGGIVLGDRNNAVYNNLIYDNYWGVDTTSKPTSGILLYNNTLYKNRHGIHISAASQNAQVINNIISQNGSGITQAGDVTAFGANLCSAPGTGCALIGEPKFANTESFDLRLQPGSPAEDAGIQVGLVERDISRVQRPQGSQYDIGAYEGTGTGLQPPPAPRNIQVR
jgi:parallel beta-helix repeat protein